MEDSANQKAVFWPLNPSTLSGLSVLSWGGTVRETSCTTQEVLPHMLLPSHFLSRIDSPGDRVKNILKGLFFLCAGPLSGQRQRKGSLRTYRAGCSKTAENKLVYCTPDLSTDLSGLLYGQCCSCRCDLGPSGILLTAEERNNSIHYNCLKYKEGTVNILLQAAYSSE